MKYVVKLGKEMNKNRNEQESEIIIAYFLRRDAKPGTTTAVAGPQITEPDSQGLHLRYPRYGEDPDTGWSRGTQIVGA